MAVNGGDIVGKKILFGVMGLGAAAVVAAFFLDIPPIGDGTAGTPVQITGVTLTAPDGMRLVAPNTILVAESFVDTLSEVSVNATTNIGTRTVLSNRLDRPSS